MERRVFIETYGCQMNEADSELMFGLLRHRGWSVAPSADDADVVLLNTCAVRERAEERVFGRLGWLKSLKDRRPEVVLGVAGCMAERMRGQIVERAPYVDLVIGPDAYRRLPDLVDAAQDEDRADALIDVRLDKRETYADAEIDRVPGVSGWITVQRGCDKFCTFCIVPFVRGRERSLPPDEVVAQARAMAAEGFREVTLLGQTVSSYYERGHDFADLLSAVHDVEGLHRIRYTSPYPNDFSDRLLERLAALPRVGRHIHLPVQSGSTPMLRAMKRGYTAEAYRGLIDRVRRILPDFALSTDIIVGYPGETEADFEATLQLMRDVGFDSAFMFRYSEREGTFSARNVADDVPDEVKRERLQRLIALQEGISKVRYGAMVGRTVEVLVQGPSRRDPSRFIGRTSCFRTTILPEGDFAPGDLVPARVVAATSHTLFGEGDGVIRIRDPIHGSIVISPDELAVVDHRVYQRLRGVKQLGFTDMAFPGATHTRYAHGLGAMEVATRMFDALFPLERAHLPPATRARFRQMVRLALLLHDVGHPPASHASEAAMPKRRALALDCFSEAEQDARASHEDYTILLLLKSALGDVLRRRFGEAGVSPEDIAHLVSGRFPARAAGFVEGGVDYYPVLSQLVSGEMDADRMDYLQRDSFFAGVSYGKFDMPWLLENLSHHVEGDRALLALSHRAVFAFEDFLLSRYHMFVSVYYHYIPVGFDTMLVNFYKEAPDDFALPGDAEGYAATDDVALWSALRSSSNRWAQRIAQRQAFRRLLETNAEAGEPDVDDIAARLNEAGVEHFVSTDRGVLSKYYGRGTADRPIYVHNRALKQVQPVDEYSRIYERYAQPTKLVRVYCRPDQFQTARSVLEGVAPLS